ncbi:sensor histidine kinase [Kordia periserrulae]|uniref:sensor histidine kinase n=1 Tax=Kordia periserrulae TaxID=701523 RepID=UPI001304C100|nr:histidine kinase [Kordia periserrulae]
MSFFIITWEWNDYFIKKHTDKDKFAALDWFSGLKILGKTLLLTTPLFAIVYYLGTFQFAEFLDCETDKPWLQFRTDFLRASLLAITVIIFNLFYYASKIRKEMEKRLYKLEKEMAVSQYHNLENQISPHFLFNSLNTLTSLMYEDRDLASDFVTRLSSCYRYILDHRNEPLISLEKELSFLDSFIFMMSVRHGMSLQISSEVALKASEYTIPTLSLQMVVENALKHNYYSVESPLLIRVYDKEGYLVVENTLKERKEKVSTGVGLVNIKSRFAYYTNKEVKQEKTTSFFRVSLPILNKDIQMKIEPLKAI